MRTADRMRLQIERLDASGKVVGSSAVWVFGKVRPDGRAYFSASVPEAASYRVRVLSFDWKSDGGGGGGGERRDPAPLTRGGHARRPDFPPTTGVPRRPPPPPWIA